MRTAWVQPVGENSVENAIPVSGHRLYKISKQEHIPAANHMGFFFLF